MNELHFMNIDMPSLPTDTIFGMNKLEKLYLPYLHTDLCD